jgi:hypothetical protein
MVEKYGLIIAASIVFAAAVLIGHLYRYETVVVSIGPGNGGYVLRRDRLSNEYCVVHEGTWRIILQRYPEC